jgi:hypothetical protein
MKVSHVSISDKVPASSVDIMTVFDSDERVGFPAGIFLFVTTTRPNVDGIGDVTLGIERWGIEVKIILG